MSSGDVEAMRKNAWEFETQRLSSKKKIEKKK
jgi:hypothetical protein